MQLGVFITLSLFAVGVPIDLPSAVLVWKKEQEERERETRASSCERLHEGRRRLTCNAWELQSSTASLPLSLTRSA